MNLKNCARKMKVCTCILPRIPVESIRLASFTVSPQISNTGFVAPITPHTAVTRVASIIIKYLNRGIYFDFFSMYCIQHCFICRPSDFIVSEPRRILGSNPELLRLRHWQPDVLTTRLDLIHNRLDLIHNLLDIIHYSARSHTRLDPVTFG